MRKLFEKIWKKEEGFTLIELIIVIAILAIIAAIAVPNVLSAVDNSRKTTDVTNAKMIADAAATVRAKNDTYSDALGQFDLDASGFGGEVLLALNNVEPKPKYQNTTTAWTETDFVIQVNADGSIKVHVSDGALDYADTGLTALPANVNEVFPTPVSDYTNK